MSDRMIIDYNSLNLSLVTKIDFYTTVIQYVTLF